MGVLMTADKLFMRLEKLYFCGKNSPKVQF